MSSTRITHYEVLGVKQDCTPAQLKTAFLNLSKKFHPDINSSDTKLHNKFVKINEAYSVLRAADSRRAYDLKIRGGPPGYNPYNFSSESLRRANPWPQYHQYQYEENPYVRRQRYYYDPSIDPTRTRSRTHYREDSYYGFKGIPRQSNYAIVAACMLFVALGSMVQFVTIMHGSPLNRSLLKQQSDKRVIIYGQAKKTAQENGNEKQIEVLAKTLGHDVD